MPRSEVLLAAVLMELKLRKHDHKKGFTGWKDDAPVNLFSCIQQELAKADAAWTLPGEYPEHKKFIDQLTDVMNFCMMTIDVMGGFEAMMPDSLDDAAVSFDGAGVPFRPDAVLEMLDKLILHWREKRKKVVANDSIAKWDDTEVTQAASYVDAYQSVRKNLFGATLKEDA
jgi:hypothetical protein